MRKLFLSLIFLIFIISGGAYTALAGESYILPSSPEDYLEFGEVTDIAVTENRIAVLNGSQIILQDRQSGAAQVIELSFQANKIHLTSSGIYIESDISLYYKSFEQNEFEYLEQKFHSFAVSEKYTAIATKQTVTLYNIADTHFSSPVSSQTTSGVPTHLFFISQNTVSFLTGTDITAAAGYNGDIYYISSHGFFKKGESNDTIISDAAYSAFKICGDDAYLAKSGSITVYNFPENKFVSEISSASPTAGRLGGATDISAFDHKLYISDTANKRIAETDLDGNFIKNILLTFAPLKLSANQKYAVATHSGGVAVIDTATGAEKLIGGTYHSVAAAKAKFFSLTEAMPTQGAIIKVFDYEGKELDETQLSTDKKAKDIACDISGNLYVIYESGDIFKFSSELKEQEKLTLNFTISGEIQKLIVDINSNPAVLSGGKIYYDEGEADVPEGAVSIACFYSRSEAYVLYPYRLLKSDAVEFSTVNSIDVPDFPLNTTFELVIFKSGSLYFEFDLDTSASARTYSPNELESDLAVIILHHTGNHIIFTGAITGIADKAYFSGADYEPMPKKFSGYAATSFNAYRLPSLKQTLKDDEFEFKKGEGISVMAEISHPDLECIFYEIVNQDGKVIYIPESFITLGIAKTPEAKNFESTVLFGEGIKLYKDSTLNGEFTELFNKTKVLIYEKHGGVAFIGVTIDGIETFGYIKITDLNNTDNSAVRSALIVVIIMFAVTLTTLYFLKRKPDNKFY